MKTLIFQIVLALSPIIACAQPVAVTNPHLLIGTYTKGASRGVYSYSFDLTSGKAILKDSVHTINPSYLAVSDDEKFVYSVNEVGADKIGGHVTSFSFDNKTGSFMKVNSQPSGGKDPCYLSIDKTGKWLVAGNYTSGSFSILKINPLTGRIDPATKTITHYGKGPDSLRQDKPHVHCTLFAPDNKFLLVTDLGTDKIVVYAFFGGSGKMKPYGFVISSTPGAGPRHMIFNAAGKHLYLVEEMSGNIEVFDYAMGHLTAMQTINSLPVGFKGKISSADIHLSNDGRFLYCSNRGESNSITVFSVNPQDGELSFVENVPCLGLTPRNFTIDPSGNYLLVANQDSNIVVVFAIDRSTGKLSDTNNRITVGSPVCLKWTR